MEVRRGAFGPAAGEKGGPLAVNRTGAKLATSGPSVAIGARDPIATIMSIVSFFSSDLTPARSGSRSSIRWTKTSRPPRWPSDSWLRCASFSLVANMKPSRIWLPSLSEGPDRGMTSATLKLRARLAIGQRERRHHRQSRKTRSARESHAHGTKIRIQVFFTNQRAGEVRHGLIARAAFSEIDGPRPDGLWFGSAAGGRWMILEAQDGGPNVTIR